MQPDSKSLTRTGANALPDAHSDDAVSADSPTARQDREAREQVRGSTLLLSGRFLALTLNLVFQVIVVRYLTKSDYGSFAFAISMVAFGATIARLGLPKAIARFVPIYHERRDLPRVAGSLVLMFGTVLGLGLSMVVLAYGAHAFLADQEIGNPLSIALFMTLIVLVPIDALDSMLETLCAAFGRVRSLIFRRYIAGPVLKLLAIGAVIAFGGDVRSLAICYLAVGVVGSLIYVPLLLRIFRHEGLLVYFRRGAFTVPVREIFSFSLPLLSGQFGLLFRGALVVVLLEMLYGTSGVAEFRAVLPFARLNLVVLTSFAFLFTPLASRLFTRNNRSKINDLYWRSAMWVVVLTSPIFFTCFSMARPVTVFMLGERYAEASPVLALLALGFFVDAALGFNVQTLRVLARVRQIAAIDLFTIVLAVGLNLWLIPIYGALGAGVAVCATMILQNIGYQTCLWLTTDIGAMHRRYFRVYLCVSIGAAFLLTVQLLYDPPIYVGGLLVVSMSGLVLLVSRGLLEVETVFPELLRLPLARRLLVPSQNTT